MKKRSIMIHEKKEYFPYTINVELRHIAVIPLRRRIYNVAFKTLDVCMGDNVYKKRYKSEAKK